jgi:hypothetical protein
MDAAAAADAAASLLEDEGVAVGWYTFALAWSCVEVLALEYILAKRVLVAALEVSAVARTVLVLMESRLWLLSVRVSTCT